MVFAASFAPTDNKMEKYNDYGEGSDVMTQKLLLRSATLLIAQSEQRQIAEHEHEVAH